MKKIFVFVAILLATCTAVSAENTTRIGAAHSVDYGVFYGYSTGALCNYGMAFLDINADNSNFRTRLNLGLAERWFKGGNGFNPNVAVDAQYLLRLADGFYLYPSIGIYGERFGKKNNKVINNIVKEFNFGLEGGLGFEVQISSGFGLFLEGNYQRMFTESTANRFGGKFGVVLAL